VDGRCPIHPSQELELIEEENYFFRFSKYQGKLLDLYKTVPDFVIPSSRLGEIRAFVERGLEDFSISRLKSKMPWGVPVPGDDEQVMYVWFDALVNYISTIGWPADMSHFEKWWNQSGGVVQYCGKDNLRQQSAMWQAMLMSANIIPSRQIIINGFITSGGKKMSKSEGNVVDPITLIAEYKDFGGADTLRYFVCRELHPFEDSDFTLEKFKNAYNSHLANGLGNLVSRIMKMASANLAGPVKIETDVALPQVFAAALDSYDLQAATNIVWQHVGALDTTIQETAPFKLVKTDKEKALEIITDLVTRLHLIATMLQPIMPETAEKILSVIKTNQVPAAPIFPRKD
jgi:methionyl-tRNA synthetase